uniref:Uncharacterized protein n=1 Tax=Salmonella enterica I TaxID=59201 RepID=A0A1P8SI35_SALET|nr:DUF2806 domain-containing protein [Salmonella enterica]APY21929.1 hypothetical protein KNPOEEDL_00004 [Salmonella enterica subsp. enterica serovar Typhimurium]
MSVGSTHHLEMVFVWKQNYILVDEYFFFCCTWIVNSAFKSKNGRIGYYGTVFSVEFQSDDSSTWKLPIGTALLTPIGQELMKICGSTPDIAYLNKFLNKINVEGSQVKLSIINM